MRHVDPPAKGTISYRNGRFWKEGFGTIARVEAINGAVVGRTGAIEAVREWLTDEGFHASMLPPPGGPMPPPLDGDRIDYRDGDFYREGVGITIKECCEAIIGGVPGAKDALIAWVEDREPPEHENAADEPEELPLEEESEFGVRVRQERERIKDRIGAAQDAGLRPIWVVIEELARLSVEGDDRAKARVEALKDPLPVESREEAEAAEASDWATMAPWIEKVAKAIHRADPGRQFDYYGPDGKGWDGLDAHLQDGYRRMAASAIDAWELGKLGQEDSEIPEWQSPMTEAEAEAISDILQVATRVGTSYETYGGVPLSQAIPIAEKALERLAPEGADVETRVIDDDEKEDSS
jgi:hypothetical protein